MKKAEVKQCTLTHGKYILISSDHCRERFDLYRASVNKKTGKDTKTLIGYGYKIEDAMDKIIRLNTSECPDVTDLKSYVAEVKKQMSEIKNLLQ